MALSLNKSALIEVPIPQPDFDRDVLQAIYDKQEADCIASHGMLQGRICIPPPQPAPAPPKPAESAPAAAQAVPVASFEGTMGWSAPGGNCVDLAKQYGKNQPGNPIGWVPTTHTPFIGAAALFYFNHVAIVTGIYPNGDVEVAQYNCPGCATRFSPSEVRGYF